MSNNAIQIAGSPSHILNAWRVLKSSKGLPENRLLNQRLKPGGGQR